MNAMKSESGGRQNTLLAALRRPECYPHAVGRVRVLETHISWVLLTGDIAYKIKKAVDLGFLDFSSLAQRRRCCEEELRLNRRYAPAIYLDVAAIRGSLEAPRIDGEGPILEYAVKMREFPQDALAQALLARGGFGAREIDALAYIVAAFHSAAAVAGTDTAFGTPDAIGAAVLENFDRLLPAVAARPVLDMLRGLRRWTVDAHAALVPAFAERRRRGCIRECHGDLHLANIVVIEARPTPFDCIEFNAGLRWIDVMSDVAFLMMDLDDHGRADLAWRFLDRYFEETGDYEGLRVLDYYRVYRALVRAKVRMLRAAGTQTGAARTEDDAGFGAYLALAARLTAPRRPALLITHGFSGCGKSTVAQMLVERMGAVRVRSDVERKRLHGLAALQASGSAPGAGIYTPAATAATYDRLAAVAQTAIESGHHVVVDAAFLSRGGRERFRALAARLGASFLIASIEAPESVLRARVAARARQSNDASEAGTAVLERQLAGHEPLAPAEMPYAVALDGRGLDDAGICDPLLRRLAGG
jgi:aminoglycoside phosphotransferase family enzyme/predicted kinase